MAEELRSICKPLLVESDEGSASRTAWYEVAEIGIEGRGWSDVKAPYDRLPAKADGVVPRKVWALSRHTAGLYVRFRTDARIIRANWKVRFRVSSSHMPDTAVCGLDCYSRADNGWRWVGLGQPLGRGLEFNDTILEEPPAGMHEYLLYLPLFSALRYLRLGFNEEAKVFRSEPFPSSLAQPYCFYGTSLTQGASVSRPGKAHTAGIGRVFGRPVINLGFSGHGLMDISIAELMAELDCSYYFVDCVYNMTPESLRVRGRAFITHLRAARKDTPIVLISPPPYDNDWFLEAQHRNNQEKIDTLHEVFAELKDSGINNLHLVDLSRYPRDAESAVGNHISEIGHYRIVRALEAALKDLGEIPKE